MRTEISQKIEQIIQKTTTNSIIWKRINSTTYEWTAEVRPVIGEKLIGLTDIGYSIQKNEGRFLLGGRQRRYSFTMTDLKNKELLFEIQASCPFNEDGSESLDDADEEYEMLQKLFTSTSDQHDRKILDYLNKTVV
jgi:hypothetical protein